jgi:hypothetical protein
MIADLMFVGGLVLVVGLSFAFVVWVLEKVID